MGDMGAVLQSACEDVITDPALFPLYSRDGKTLLKTYCNVGTGRVARRAGCLELDGGRMMAQDMIEHIRAAAAVPIVPPPPGWQGPQLPRWRIVDGRTATLHALDGGFGCAFMDKEQLREEHAHIAPVWPKGMQRSDSLDHDVPMLANVGVGDPDAPLRDTPDKKWKTKRNWCCKSSQAFPVERGEATYAIWA